MPDTKPNPLSGMLRVVSSRSVQVATGSVVAAVLVMFNAPESLKEHVGTLITGIFALAGAVIWSWGYQDGKLNEGTVPNGRLPAATPTDTVPAPAAPPPPKPTITGAQLIERLDAIQAELKANKKPTKAKP